MKTVYTKTIYTKTIYTKTIYTKIANTKTGKLQLMACGVAAVLLLTGATVWEGSAREATGTELPAAGFFAATNSFPVNSVIDITNLENGKTVRVIVAAGLDSSGLLAVLSREAARSVELPDATTGRIRMTQPDDPIAFARFRGGTVPGGQVSSSAKTSAAQPAPVQTTAPQTVRTNSPAAGQFAANSTAGSTRQNSSGGTIRRETVPSEQWNPARMPLDEPQTFISANFAEAPPPPPPPPLDEAVPGAYNLVPSQERLPEARPQHTISPDDIIPPLESTPQSAPPPLAALPSDQEPAVALPPAAAPPVISVSVVVQNSGTNEEFVAGIDTNTEFSPFEVPMIRAIEPGVCYVQIGAYNRAEIIEDEIERAGKTYPLAIQNIGTDETPLFRILLGPFNPGESGAVLQRFKSIGYRDAFVRKN